MPTDPHLRPPRAELFALLDAVKDNPDDDTPRLVLADWLDEQDNPLDAERAAFLREQVPAARAGVPHAPPPREVYEAMVAERAWRWLGPVTDLGSVVFSRGLPTAAIEGPRLLKPDAPKLLASEAFAFVQFVYLSEAGGPRMEKLAAMPEFRHVPGIYLHPFSSFGADSAARFFASPNLTGLRQIDFRSVKPGAVGMQALAANPALSRLRKLRLAHNKLVDKAVAALAVSQHFALLTHLDLSDNNIGDGGAGSLAVSVAFPNLRELDLRLSPRLTDAGKQRLRDAFGDRVKLD